jgi:hypothetical protein
MLSKLQMKTLITEELEAGLEFSSVYTTGRCGNGNGTAFF